MNSRLPWIAAALVLVAAVGAWAIYGATPAAQPTPTPTPTPGAATVTIGSTSVAFTGGIPSGSGIENVYFLTHSTTAQRTYDNADNVNETDNHDNLLTYGGQVAIIEASGASISIPYDNTFDIVVGFKIHTNDVSAIAQLENFHIGLIATGAVAIDENSSSLSMFSLDNSTNAGATWGRYNAVFNGGGAGYSLSAGSNFTIDNIDLWAF